MPRFGYFEQYFNNSGDILNGGKLYFYESGTTTPKTTYADINQTTPNPNPVVLSAAGRQGNIWFSGVAKVVLTTSADVILQTLDPVGDTDVQAQFSTWVPTFSYAMYSVVLYDGLFYVSLINNNLGNTPDASPTDWQLAGDFFLESQSVVNTGEIAIGNATTGLSSINTKTKGTIPVGNGTTTTTLAAGTDGYYLKYDSTQPTGIVASPSTNNGWQLLSTVTTAGAATVDVETGFSSTYDNYVILAYGLTTAGTENILARWKIGGSYITTSTYIDVSGTTTATSLVAVPNAGGSAMANGSLQYYVFGANSAVAKFGRVISQSVQGTPNLATLNAAHFNTGTGVLSGVRFYGSGGGNIAGTFALYGVTKS